jgi:hypothetical protein
LIDPHISALLLEMKADLNDGSPAGSLYGESLANALVVYLLNVMQCAGKHQLSTGVSESEPLRASI